MNNLAVAYQDAGQLAKALPLYEETLAKMKAKLGPDHPDTLASTNNLANTYKFDGQLAKALPLFEQAAAGIEKRRFVHRYAGTIIPNTIGAYETAQQLDKAEAWRRKWLAFVKVKAGPNSPAYASELNGLGSNLLKQEKWAHAEPIIRESLEIRARTQPDIWPTFNTKSMLGASLLGQKKYQDVEPLLKAGYEGMKAREKTMTPQAKSRLPEAAQRLVQLYEATDRKAEAEKWAKVVAEYRRQDGKLLDAIHDIGKELKLTGKLDGDTPALIYQIRLKAGITYVIDMVSPDQKALDPYLYLRDEKGNTLAEDDDSGGGLNARITYRVNADGVYRIRATSFSNGRGDFTLTVRPKE